MACIGLLGGSFNPAHAGHLHISLWALARLRLDGVWWLVSPQNPLKSTEGMGSYADRMAAARAVAKAEPRIEVSDFEREAGTRYTIDTLLALKRHYPEHRFVFLMGADLFIQLPRWRSWTTILRTVPIAVFPRPSYSKRALSSRAARRFAAFRVPEIRAPRLANAPPPAWAFVPATTDPTSATRIRRLLAAKRARLEVTKGIERRPNP
jgi:nicotinate-nucleotide adenylyltransferase